jgi:acyl carrier protein
MVQPGTCALDREDLRRTFADVLDVDASEVTDEASFAEDLGVDSLLALELLLVLEKHYGVTFDESQLREVTSLSRAYSLLDDKLGGGS